MSNIVEQQVQKPEIDFSGMENTKAIDILSSLPILDYEQARDRAAKALNIRAKVLDDEVKKARKAESERTADYGLFETVQPSFEPVSGDALLSRIETLSIKHVICEQHTRTSVSLWIALTWLTDHVDCLPIANITAPEKNCGKSTLLAFIGKLAYKPLTTSNTTSSALFRIVEEWQPTLLIDEADSFADDDEALRGIINAGHTRDSAYVIRCVGDDHEPQRFSVWGAKALCGIGKRAGTIESRSINLILRRKRPDEQTSRLKTSKTDFEEVKSQLARWADDNGLLLASHLPTLPPALQNRDADNWEPLLAIADLAGGVWPDKARQAALASLNLEDSLSINQELLSDIRELLEPVHSKHIFSADLVEQLLNIEDAPWLNYNRGRPLTQRQLTTKLKDFGIHSGTRKLGGLTKKGYTISDFQDAFERYLPAPPISSVTSSPSSNGGAYSDFENVTSYNKVTNEKRLQANENAGGDEVTNKNRVNGSPLPWSTKI